jgi:hypothetical protein
MRQIRTVATIVVAGALFGSACAAGTPIDVLVSERSETAPDRDAPEPTGQVNESPPVAETLSVEDSLLRDDDVSPPWESQHRHGERTGYGAGPNQTDCGPYWEYERLHDLPGGNVLWWRDGGNLNHEVFRADSAAAATTFMNGMRELAEACAITSWGEGDSFRIESLDLGDSEIVGLQFVQPIPDELHHVAITAHGDLISVVWIVQWPPFDGTAFPHTTVDDLASHAATARARLLEAGPATAPTPTTPEPAPLPTSTTVPGTPSVPVTLHPDVTLHPGDTIPPDLIDPPVAPPITDALPPDDLRNSMLVDDDLLLVGWEAGTPHEYESIDSDPPVGDDCAAQDATERIEQIFEWEKDLFDGSESRGIQFVGEMDSERAAAELVVDFGGIVDCDLSEWLAGGTGSSSPIDIPEATEAIVLSLRYGGEPGPEDDQFARVYLLAVGTTVAGFTFTFEGLDDDVWKPTRIVEIAATKLASR